MLITLRPYQENLREKIRESFAKSIRSVLLVLPTGAGKTCVFCDIVERTVRKGNSVYILVHRQELLKQTSRHLEKLGVPHGIIAPGHSMTGDRVQVASVQTLVRRLERARKPDLIIVDECHHTMAGTWKKILDHWNGCFLLGVTATPIRLDGKGLGVKSSGFYEHIIIGPSIRWLIDKEYLSQPRVYGPNVGIDLSGVKTVAGDFDKHEVITRVDKPKITGCAVEHYMRICPNSPAIAFCVSVKHAEHVAEQFNNAGIPAAHLSADLADSVREYRISALGSGSLRVLTSCDIISEGTDIPVVGAAILLRPTQSTGLYLQQVGRALRKYPGKTNAIILDHVGNWERHGLPDDDREWSLDPERIVKRKKSDKAQLPNNKRCSVCYAVFSASFNKCPQCGAEVKITEREIKQVGGELKEINRITIEEYKARINRKREQGLAKTLPELIEIAKERNYNRGWALSVFNARKAKEFKKNLQNELIKVYYD